MPQCSAAPILAGMTDPDTIAVYPLRSTRALRPRHTGSLDEAKLPRRIQRCRVKLQLGAQPVG